MRHGEHIDSFPIFLIHFAYFSSFFFQEDNINNCAETVMMHSAETNVVYCAKKL